jgi:hypothetical protein
MKKITTLFIAATSIFVAAQFMSCKKDKKSDPKTLVGTWTSVSITSKETTNGVVTGSGTLNIPGLLAITFNSDNTYKRYTPLDPTVTENGKYQTIGTKMILNYTENGVSNSDTSDYEFSEDSFIMKEITTEIYGSETIISEDKTTYKRG